MEKDIEHKGLILDIIGQRLDVSIIAESACASCKVKGVCGMSETEEKIISVICEYPQMYEVGEQVIVSVEQGMGTRAVMIAYVFPFLLMFGILLLMTHIGVSEAAAGLSSLGMLGIYYVFLFLMRGRIEKEITFKIKKI